MNQAQFQLWECYRCYEARGCPFPGRVSRGVLGAADPKGVELCAGTQTPVRVLQDTRSNSSETKLMHARVSRNALCSLARPRVCQVIIEDHAACFSGMMVAAVLARCADKRLHVANRDGGDPRLWAGLAKLLLAAPPPTSHGSHLRAHAGRLFVQRLLVLLFLSA